MVARKDRNRGTVKAQEFGGVAAALISKHGAELVLQGNLLPLQPILLDLRRNRFVATIPFLLQGEKSVTIVHGIMLGERRRQNENLVFACLAHLIWLGVMHLHPVAGGWPILHTLQHRFQSARY